MYDFFDGAILRFLLLNCTNFSERLFIMFIISYILFILFHNKIDLCVLRIFGIIKEQSILYKSF